jgi:hypothetical protein
MPEIMTRATTLSSVGVSASLMLDPKAKSTVLTLTSLTTTSSLDATVWVTLDTDPTVTPTWALLSSIHYSSIDIELGGGVTLTVLSPIGGVRIASTTIVAGETITLKALQSISA